MQRLLRGVLRWLLLVFFALGFGATAEFVLGPGPGSSPLKTVHYSLALAMMLILGVMLGYLRSYRNLFYTLFGLGNIALYTCAMLIIFPPQFALGFGGMISLAFVFALWVLSRFFESPTEASGKSNSSAGVPDSEHQPVHRTQRGKTHGIHQQALMAVFTLCLALAVPAIWDWLILGIIWRFGRAEAGLALALFLSFFAVGHFTAVLGKWREWPRGLFLCLVTLGAGAALSFMGSVLVIAIFVGPLLLAEIAGILILGPIYKAQGGDDDPKERPAALPLQRNAKPSLRIPRSPRSILEQLRGLARAST